LPKLGDGWHGFNRDDLDFDSSRKPTMSEHFSLRTIAYPDCDVCVTHGNKCQQDNTDPAPTKNDCVARIQLSRPLFATAFELAEIEYLKNPCPVRWTCDRSYKPQLCKKTSRERLNAHFCSNRYQLPPSCRAKAEEFADLTQIHGPVIGFLWLRNL
jgi:hypothetical protein